MALMENFTHKGERWQRVPAETRERFVLGADLGQSTDPTALCVLHWTQRPLESWTTKRGNTNTLTQDTDERFDIRHLERLPLGMSYPAIVQHTADVLSRPPLADGCDLVIDETGVGRAVGDIFEDAGMRPTRVTITAGSEATDQGNKRWHVAKGILISTLDARLHTGELRFAAELQEADAMAEELKDFRRRVTDAGRATYAARTGRHDDLVLAVAIATWWAARPRFEVGCGHVVGLY